jgi:hypothetical protein
LRDDAEGTFLTFYLEDGALERKPFERDPAAPSMRCGSVVTQFEVRGRRTAWTVEDLDAAHPRAVEARGRSA